MWQLGCLGGLSVAFRIMHHCGWRCCSRKRALLPGHCPNSRHTSLGIWLFLVGPCQADVVWFLGRSIYVNSDPKTCFFFLIIYKYIIYYIPANMHFVTWCYLALMRKNKLQKWNYCTRWKNDKKKKQALLYVNNTIHTNVYTVYVSRATLPRVSSTAKNERQIP